MSGRDLRMPSHYAAELRGAHLGPVRERLPLPTQFPRGKGSCRLSRYESHRGKKMRSGIAIIIGCWLCFAPPAEAELQIRDLAVPADGKITYDDQTGLEWLDLTETVNLSYNEIIGGIGNTWIADGWRYATSEDMCLLVGTYATLPVPTCPLRQFWITPHDPAEIMALQGLFGVTEPWSVGGRAGGFFDDGPEYWRSIGWASFTYAWPHAYNWNEGYGAEVESDDIRLDEKGPLWGNWLVRDAPEPSAAVSQAAVLIALSWFRSRPRRFATTFRN